VKNLLDKKAKERAAYEKERLAKQKSKELTVCYFYI
jgi:hypothetical protein